MGSLKAWAAKWLETKLPLHSQKYFSFISYWEHGCWYFDQTRFSSGWGKNRGTAEATFNPPHWSIAWDWGSWLLCLRSELHFMGKWNRMMEISDIVGWIITPKSLPSALNLHHDRRALPSISPQQISKSWQSVALSFEPLLIHLANSHYGTGWYWTLPLTRNPSWPILFLHSASLILCLLSMAVIKYTKTYFCSGVNAFSFGHVNPDRLR